MAHTSIFKDIGDAATADCLSGNGRDVAITVPSGAAILNRKFESSSSPP